MTRSPPASSLPAGALPSPNSAIRPSAKAIQPRSITRSASTILALPRAVSCFAVSSSVAVILRRLPSYRGKRGHVDDPVGDQLADLIVVDDGDHGNTCTLFFIDQIHHDGAIGGIQRSR